MAEVVKLKAGDALPQADVFLVVTRLSRPRVFEYFIDVSPALEPMVGRRLPPGGPGYASLETALHAAQELAEQNHVPTIYVQHESILVRPYYPGLNLP
ncbi:hypothetical protein [uncultured Caulobacter sp.]|uniref:hypothetical protein n=1 Tax=uncultured Caulobacter sp. TaxID=158749 RepID=UPI002631CF11|nr:hypothetical protein [uncultured Caulobacter sp.]